MDIFFLSYRASFGRFDTSNSFSLIRGLNFREGLGPASYTGMKRKLRCESAFG